MSIADWKTFDTLKVENKDEDNTWNNSYAVSSTYENISNQHTIL